MSRSSASASHSSACSAGRVFSCEKQQTPQSKSQIQGNASTLTGSEQSRTTVPCHYSEALYKKGREVCCSSQAAESRLSQGYGEGRWKTSHEESFLCMQTKTLSAFPLKSTGTGPIHSQPPWKASVLSSHPLPQREGSEKQLRRPPKGPALS